MSCSNKKPNASLLVTLDGIFDAASSAQKTRLGFTAARTAERAAEAWGCETDPGQDRVNDIPGDKSMKPESSGEVKGACQGINTSTIGSSADANAPIENCLIQSKDGLGTQYILGAYYPPFSKARTLHEINSSGLAGKGDDTYWGSAVCSNGERARYIIEPSVNYDGRDTDGSETFSGDAAGGKKQALKEFASRSAKRHGCTGLTLP
ncbi:hypothetical protein OHU45_26765 [Streptomyces tubercidicus]|uniref:hypothetical protein n=1 Tax=Streptomyces tubercidicus TaxID=47759 RepID=UPI00324EF96A